MPKAGWGWPGLAKKAHYFIDGRSLCSRWFFTGTLEKANDQSPANCVACKKILEKTKP